MVWDDSAVPNLAMALMMRNGQLKWQQIVSLMSQGLVFGQFAAHLGARPVVKILIGAAMTRVTKEDSGIPTPHHIHPLVHIYPSSMQNWFTT